MKCVYGDLQTPVVEREGSFLKKDCRLPNPGAALYNSG